MKIIKLQFFTTLDLLLSALNIHNLKMAFNLALNFSGWCILIFFFKSKASGTIYKHDMSHLLFWGGRQAGECFFNCTTDYLQFCFRWNILDTRLLLLSCIIRVRNLSGYPCPVICVPLSVQLSVIFPSGYAIFLVIHPIICPGFVSYVSFHISIFSQGYNLWFITYFSILWFLLHWSFKIGMTSAIIIAPAS